MVVRKLRRAGRSKGAALAVLAIAAAATRPGFGGEKATLTVSSCMADGSVEPQYSYQCPTLAATFAQRISVREGFAARAVRAASWQQAPEGVEACAHVSLVHAHLGAHHDFLAFLHGGPHHSIRFVARAEAIDRNVQYWFSVPTGRYQIERNAVVDLIGHFANQYPGAAAGGDRPVVTMRLEARAAKSDEPSPAAASDAELSALLPLVTGAACVAGMCPTFDNVRLQESELTPALEAPLIGMKAVLTPTGGRSVGTFDDGSCAAVVNAVGKGRTLLYGFLPGNIRIPPKRRPIPATRSPATIVRSAAARGAGMATASAPPTASSTARTTPATPTMASGWLSARPDGERS
jgi:hypothetical protein